MMINREEHIADIEDQIRAWRSMEWMAIRQEDSIAAREYHIRAETLEQQVKNLLKQAPSVVSQ